MNCKEYLTELISTMKKLFLKEKDEIVKNSRLLLLDSIKIVLENGTSILGIKTVDTL